MRSQIIAVLLAVVAVPCSAQVIEPFVITVPEDEVKVATPQCSGGVVYDDGGYEAAYSIGDGDPGDSTMVMKLDLPAGTTSLDQVCICLARANSGAPSSTNFEVVVFNDNGAGGQPGTFLGAVNATAIGIPIFGNSQFYSVNMTGSGITLPDPSVYVGVRWPGGTIALCGDGSASTTQRSNFGSANGGTSWANLTTTFPTAPPRAMGIRADPAPPAGTTCTPNSTTMCLSNNRFKVQATFQAPGQPAGTAQAVKLTEDTGYLWFFSSTNVEVVVKVLNACVAPFNRYWVFAGGLTNVRVVLTVTDTKNGSVKTYTNPQGAAYQPIQDTSAFATCP